jgi:hypothetical protein
MAPRGVRNNNPGNIERTGVPWIGEDRTPAARASEHRFCVFKSPEYGFRALVRVLLTYQRKYRLRTVAQMIDRWAPPVENNTGSYVREVARALGVKPGDRIDVTNYDTAFDMAKAIARHENGGHFWPDSVIAQGVVLAGVSQR